MTSEELLIQLKEGKNPRVELYKGTDAMWLYHFSEERWNLLEWFPFQKEGSILQIGCGYGAMLGLFAQKLQEVCGVSDDEKQVAINRIRYKNDSNIQIIKCSLHEIPEEKYDYIYLECAEEAAWLMTKGTEDLTTLIHVASMHLKESGVLLITIGNAIGLSTLAGKKDYHSESCLGKTMHLDNMHQYSAMDIYEIINQQNLSVKQVYYPVPDFRFPEVIYSSKHLPREGEIQRLGYSYGEESYENFPEDEIMNQVCKNNCFEQLANSFLFVVTKK